MGTPKATPARMVAERATRRVHDALKPLLTAAGVRVVEREIGRPQRFFQKTRERDALRLSDYLATCAALDQDPAPLLARALAGQVELEIRPPQIVAAGWRQLEQPARPGLGQVRLAELEAAVQTEPRATREALRDEIRQASRREVPHLIGYYGSCLRVQSDLARAVLVLREALRMSETAELEAAEPDLLIRLAYAVFEQQRIESALGYSMEATLAYGRLGDREGVGTGYLATGMFRYYAHDYRRALRDLDASLQRTTSPGDQFAGHQVSALCWLALEDEENARQGAARARELALDVPGWSVAKLDWLESWLTRGAARLDLLAAARAGLCPHRPGDCALVTVELIAEAVNLGRHEVAEAETTGLCALLERTSSPRIEAAILDLVRHRSRLWPDLVAKARRAVERARDRRLAQLATSD